MANIQGFVETDWRRKGTDIFWAKMQPILLKRGYRLRPRYDPDWEPSWLQPRSDGTFIKRYDAEDSIPGLGMLMDAVHIVDSQKVAMKIVGTKSEEIPIVCFLSSPEMLKAPKNCTVPILDVVLIPEDDDHAVLIMPQLLVLDALPFRRLGELCEAATQILDGFEFLHEHNIAHRDVCIANLTMDVSKTIPQGYHFMRFPLRDGLTDVLDWKPRWSVRPNHYYIIDYGFSHRCSSNSEKVLGRMGQDLTVPEMSDNIPYDPFKSDVCQLGNAFKELMGQYIGFEPFSKLVEAMTTPDPAARPTAAEASKMCHELVEQLDRSKKLKKRVWLTYDGKRSHIRGISRFIFYVFRTNPLT